MANPDDEAAPGPGPTDLRDDWRDPWLIKLVEDPGKIPSVMLLSGYLADSPDEKAIRVFFDLQLWWCIDIPKDAVLHREEIPKSTSWLGGSYLWIDRGAWSTCKTYWRQY